MRSGETFFDDVTLRRYASAHHDAAEAARHVRGAVGRDTWVRVIDTMNRADEDVARCDEAWLELRTAYLEMMATNASPQRLRRERWAEWITTACRYRGPDSDPVARMRGAAKQVARHRSRGEARRLERALHRMHDAMDRSDANGVAPVALVDATWRLAKGYRELFMADPLSHAVARTVHTLPDGAMKTEVARGGAQLCADVGQVETARELYQISYAAETERLAAQDDFAARREIIAMRHRLAEYHLMNGQAARAETLVRGALLALPDLREAARNRREAMAWSTVHDACRCLLPDCLFVRGRWREARDAYREAHADFAMIERPTVEDTRTANLLRNAAIYTGREWQSHR